MKLDALEHAGVGLSLAALRVDRCVHSLSTMSRVHRIAANGIAAFLFHRSRRSNHQRSPQCAFSMSVDPGGWKLAAPCLQWCVWVCVWAAPRLKKGASLPRTTTGYIGSHGKKEGK